MYKLLRSILFCFDPEKVHYFSMNSLKTMVHIPVIKGIMRDYFWSKNSTSILCAGLTFPNVVGLAAGFDKNAKYLYELDSLGFGFVEIGTVTPKPQKGNPRPRLFRLPKDRAIINRMGFNNDGAEKIARRLKKFKVRNNHSAGRLPRMIIGGNIGKNKDTPNEDAWKDYEFCFNALHKVVDYFVVNVSSPNTPGLRELQQKESLKKILTHLQAINETKMAKRPIFLKIAPDLTQEALDEVIDLALEINLDGIVAANTTISREGLNTPTSRIEKMGAGGLSGKPLKERSREITRYIASKTEGKIPIISSGGIFTSQDAQERIDEGATLIQVWTGFIYEGPVIAKKILKGLQFKKAEPASVLHREDFKL